MSENRTEISSLGEFGLIEHLTANIEIKNASTLVGVGDDAAVIDHFGKQTVVTTDLLLEEVHFDLMYTPLQHLGYKSVVVNLSDVYAMNATPTQITLSLGISNRFSVEALDESVACGVGGAGDDVAVSPFPRQQHLQIKRPRPEIIPLRMDIIVIDRLRELELRIDPSVKRRSLIVLTRIDVAPVIKRFYFVHK